VLARQRAAGGPDPGEQAGVGAGIGNVEAAAQHDDGAPAGVEGAGVGSRVDADGSLAGLIVLLDRVLPHATHHRDTPLGGLLL
jgi:hypothetical protein